MILQWLESYMYNQNLIVTLGDLDSNIQKLACKVPQGSIVGPLLLSQFMLPLGHISSKHNISYCNYGDVMQLFYLTIHRYLPTHSLVRCLVEINHWMAVYILQPNREKTDCGYWC